MTTLSAESKSRDKRISILDDLCCPRCGSALMPMGVDGLACGRGHAFTIEGGIPRLFEAEGAVTGVVKNFYEETPFPNYDDLDNRLALVKKASTSLFAKLLFDQLSPTAKILEAGCGTGQLSNYLGTCAGRLVYATDMCMNSLRLGKRFADANHIRGVRFIQMNVFTPCFLPGRFDCVIGNGVLHHTHDARRAFLGLVDLVRPGGYIVIGLYNLFARLPTDVRRVLFRWLGEGTSFLDARLRTLNLSQTQRRAWFMDQYRHPHETKHTYDEVIDWFAQAGVEPLMTIPKVEGRFSTDDQVFAHHGMGTPLRRLMVQFDMLIEGGREGGFFTFIGQKRAQRESRVRE